MVTGYAALGMSGDLISESIKCHAWLQVGYALFVALWCAIAATFLWGPWGRCHGHMHILVGRNIIDLDQYLEEWGHGGDQRDK